MEQKYTTLRKADLSRVEEVTKYIEKAPRNKIRKPEPPRRLAPANRWFWTTAAISGASHSGTTLTTATLTQGSGSARIGITDTGGIVKPDVSTGAADETIYNGLTNAIPIHTWVLCVMTDGKFVASVADCAS